MYSFRGSRANFIIYSIYIVFIVVVGLLKVFIWLILTYCYVMLAQFFVFVWLYMFIFEILIKKEL